MYTFYGKFLGRNILGRNYLTRLFKPHKSVSVKQSTDHTINVYFLNCYKLWELFSNIFFVYLKKLFEYKCVQRYTH